MDEITDRRSRKRLATRQKISTAANRLFMQRGFDDVTVDEIAEAADVGRMTVFNHFPRKEDMFFDRADADRDMVVAAMARRKPGISAIEALRLQTHRLVSESSPIVEFSPMSWRLIEAVEASVTLRARERAIRDELRRAIAAELTRSVGRDPLDPLAQLAASWLIATWRSAMVAARVVYRDTGKQGAAHDILLSIVDRGLAGLKAAMADTAYA